MPTLRFTITKGTTPLILEGAALGDNTLYFCMSQSFLKQSVFALNPQHKITTKSKIMVVAMQGKRI